MPVDFSQCENGYSTDNVDTPLFNTYCAVQHNILTLSQGVMF